MFKTNNQPGSFSFKTEKQSRMQVECPYQKAVSVAIKQPHKNRFETKVCLPVEYP